MSGTEHVYHPDSHTHGLADGCPRCEEHAAHPERSMDAFNRARLLTGQVLTDLDRTARANLLRHLQRGAAVSDTRVPARTLLDGVVVRCRGCGRHHGITCVAFDEGYVYEPPAPFPFPEDDCPVCLSGAPEQIEQAAAWPRGKPRPLP